MKEPGRVTLGDGTSASMVCQSPPLDEALFVDPDRENRVIEAEGQSRQDRPFVVRGATRQLRAINYLVEAPAGVYIDAIQIRQAKSK